MTTKNKKVLITEFTRLLENRLGIDGVDAYEHIIKTLEQNAKKRNSHFTSEYMTTQDLVIFRDEFLKMVDIKMLNPLDYQSFLDNTNSLLEYGSIRKNITNMNCNTNNYIKVIPKVYYKK